MLKKQLSCLVTVLALAFASTTGCNSNKDLFAPVEAPEIKNIFEPTYVWSASTQGSDKFYSQLVPCISGRQLYIAGREGKVYSFDATNGDKTWVVDLSDEEENDNKRSARISGGVSASDHLLALGSENGYLYVLSKTDGSIYFKYYLGKEIVSVPAFNASGDKLFVQDSTGGVTAFDLNTKAAI